MSKYKIGDKVVPINKSKASSLATCITWRNANEINQPYLYVIRIDYDKIVCDEKINGTGDLFLESDLILYVEPFEKVELPKQNFGIIIENNAKEIIKWFEEHGYDRNEYYGNITEGTYYVNDNKRIHFTSLKTGSNIEIYKLEELLNMESKFPEKWCIKGCPELHEYCCEKINGRDRTNVLGSDKRNYYYKAGTTNEGVENWNFITNPMSEGYTEITFEQFLTNVLKQDKEIKEILGYKCPTALFGGAVPKGTIFEKTSSSGMTMYPTNCNYAVPKEIVEQWEPVYKEDELKVGDWVIGWHCDYGDYSNIPWKIIGFSGNYAIPQPLHSTSKEHLRKATTEEVKSFLVSQAKEKGFVEGLPLNNIQVPTDNISYIGNIQWQYASYAPAYDRLTMQGVTIYKDGIWATIKPQKEVVKLQQANGASFELEISNKGIYYASESTWLDIEKLLKFHKDVIQASMMSGTYKFNISHIDMGCKKQVPITDFNKVIDLYNKLQK